MVKNKPLHLQEGLCTQEVWFFRTERGPEEHNLTADVAQLANTPHLPRSLEDDTNLKLSGAARGHRFQARTCFHAPLSLGASGQKTSRNPGYFFSFHLFSVNSNPISKETHFTLECLKVASPNAFLGSTFSKRCCTAPVLDRTVTRGSQPHPTP